MVAATTRILVPVDGSVSSSRATEKAVFLAEKCGAVLDFLFVGEELSQALTSEAIFAEIFKNIPAPLTAEKHLASGNVPQAILDTAKTCGADLIVMGSRGLGIFRGAFLGSVSQKVMEDSSIPVLIVK